MMFFPRKFLKKEDGDRIIESIRKAETNTSGEIRVHFQRMIKEDIMEAGTKVFYKLGMDKTEARNGVLIFVVPLKRQFCILGDSGIDEVVPENFWEDIKDDMRSHFKKDMMADGLCINIEKIGDKLKEFFPIQSDDENELPDTISYG
jgi:uncharacterized membrane protein